MRASKLRNIHRSIVYGWNNDIGPYINLIAYITIPETAIAYLLKGWLRIGSAALAVFTYVVVLILCWHFGKRRAGRH